MESIKIGEFEVLPLYLGRSLYKSQNKMVCKKEGCGRKLGKKNKTGYCKFHYQRTGRKANPRSLVKGGSLSHVKTMTHGAD